MRADMSVTSMLDREVYVYAEVDKLIGLSPAPRSGGSTATSVAAKITRRSSASRRELRRGLRGASSSRLACLLNTATAGKCQ